MRIRKYIYYCAILMAFLGCYLNKVIANESIFIKRYGFGFERRSSDGKPIVYLSNPSVAEGGGEYNDSSDDVDVRLAVKQSADSVLAFVTFTNNSNQLYFLPKIYYPMRFEKINGEMFDALCDKKISITTGSVSLDYLSGSCPFDFDISEYVKINPTEKVSLQIKLNDMYAFLPGEQDYFIKAVKYKLVKSKWFVFKSIDKIFFSILMRQNHCDKYNQEAIFNNGIVCDDYEFDERMDFFIGHFLKKNDNENSIYVSSNEVSVKVNGSKVRSPY
ncbi:hypothetical protein CTQ56_004509 [Salmonella enterica subsp. houtenae]|nr:hypothetical protein [Salmonella enterica subsp. enterica]EAS4519638.1 hypothetical protein [Salmonella enterica]ECI5130195.1 hypothetical protein [Salmonella enterica subsp. houtenae]EEK1482621.1 hypothetical protein [Salmonella enterica subsp. enterica serovar Typhimurium]EHB8804074.1 hypothetical protein [Salmonella enterica subsp. enterica serovar Rough O:z4,z23:-]